MFNFIYYIKKSKQISLFLSGLAVTFSIALLVYPDKAIVAFLAQQLGYPSLMFLNAVLWIIPVIYLRAGIKGLSPDLNVWSLIIPFSIILLVCVLSNLDYFSQDSAAEIGCIAAITPWEEIVAAIGKNFTTSFTPSKLATMGGVDTGMSSKQPFNKGIGIIFFSEGSSSVSGLGSPDSGLGSGLAPGSVTATSPVPVSYILPRPYHIPAEGLAEAGSNVATALPAEGIGRGSSVVATRAMLVTERASLMSSHNQLWISTAGKPVHLIVKDPIAINYIRYCLADVARYEQSKYPPVSVYNCIALRSIVANRIDYLNHIINN